MRRKIKNVTNLHFLKMFNPDKVTVDLTTNTSTAVDMASIKVRSDVAGKYLY